MKARQTILAKSLVCIAIASVLLLLAQIQAFAADKKIDLDFDRIIFHLKSAKGIKDFHDWLKAAEVDVKSDSAFKYVMRHLSAAEYFYFLEFNKFHTPAELRREFCEIAAMYLGREFSEMEFIAFRYKEDKLSSYPQYYERDFIYLLGIKPNKEHFMIVRVGGINRDDLPWCGVGVGVKFQEDIYPIEELMCLPM